MAASLSVRVLDIAQTEKAKMYVPLKRDGFQILTLPVELDGKTYFVEATIDLTGLSSDE